MSNTHFQFKQFRIEQDRSAMKVTTEGCLLGGLVSLKSKDKVILDIGTGTGLLALMLAQRSEERARIDAVELSKEAAEQAAINFDNSPWSTQLKIYPETIQKFAEQANQKFNLIVSNPPFFKGHFKSGKAKDQAIHNDELSLEDLAYSVTRLLQESGRFWVIYPQYEFEQFVTVAKIHGLILQRQFEIYDRPGKPIFRKIGVFAFEEIGEPDSEVIFIKEADRTYSQRFQSLVAPYYL